MAKSKTLSKRYEYELLKADDAKVLCIVTEGTKTEPEYFKNFLWENGFINESKYIVIAPGDKSEPDKVFKTAENLKRKHRNATVFLVIDHDDRKSKNLKSVMDNCADFGKIDKTKINCIFSNRQFEFWGILHFTQTHREMNKSEIEKETLKYFKNYNSKDNKVLDFRFIPKDGHLIACKNAKITRGQNGYTKRSATNVDELIEYIFKRLRRKRI